MKRLALLLTTGLMLVACIYPIDDTEELTGYEGVAIEGTITVGAVSSFAMYPLQALSYDENEGKGTVSASFTVEDDMGHSWTGTPDRKGWSSDLQEAGTSFVDLTDADPSRKYRLRARNLETNESYVSEWVEVVPACTIDSVNFIKNIDEDELLINLNVHGNGGAGCYRLMTREDWEYKADYSAALVYIPNDKKSRDPGVMVNSGGQGPLYYCWKKAIDSKLNIFDTRTLTSDEVTRPLMKIPRTDERLGYVYSITAGVMSISEEHYAYLEHLATVSDYNGSLFSPNPSEMHGNIRNESDSTHFVAGFIGAGTLVQQRLFYENEKEYYYIPGKRNVSELESVQAQDWQYAYWYESKMPVYYTMTEGYLWTEKRCVDCRYKGGNKDKPDFWINNHE